MAVLTGITETGQEVPVQVKPDGRLVAEGLTGPAGGIGPAGPVGPAGPAGPAGPTGPQGSLRYEQGQPVSIAGSAQMMLGPIPTWAKRITVAIEGVQLQSTGDLVINVKAGDSWAYQDYRCTAFTSSDAGVATVMVTPYGVGVPYTSAPNSLCGVMEFVLGSSNYWTVSGSGIYENAAKFRWTTNARMILPGPIQELQAHAAGTGAAFTAGKVTCSWLG